MSYSEEATGGAYIEIIYIVCIYIYSLYLAPTNLHWKKLWM